jgi:hypothetical protein
VKVGVGAVCDLARLVGRHDVVLIEVEVASIAETVGIGVSLAWVGHGQAGVGRIGNAVLVLIAVTLGR